MIISTEKSKADVFFIPNTNEIVVCYASDIDSASLTMQLTTISSISNVLNKLKGHFISGIYDIMNLRLIA